MSIAFDSSLDAPSTHRQLAAITWAWSRTSRLRRWIFRIMLVWHIGGLLMLLGTRWAYAAPNSDGGFGWLKVFDSQGVNAGLYRLSVDQGSLLHPMNVPLSSVLEIEFQLLMIWGIIALWFIGFALSFQWLNWIAPAFHNISTSISSTLGSSGLLLITLTIAGGVAALNFMRGKIGRAGAQMAAACIIVAALGSIFSDPVGHLAGSDGLLSKARNTGLEFTQAITTGSSTGNPSQQISDTQAQLADHFLRYPSQIVNFGQIAAKTSASCGQAWSAGVKSGDVDKIKNNIASSCGADGKDMKKNADRPSWSQVGTALLFIFLNIILCGFAFVLAGRLVYTGVLALFHGILVIPAGIVGVISGGAQTFTIKCIVDSFLSAVAMMYYVVFLGTYISLVSQLLKSAGSNVVQYQFLTAGGLILGIALLRKSKGMFESQTDKISNKLSEVANSNGNAASSNGGLYSPSVSPTRVVSRGINLATRAAALVAAPEAAIPREIAQHHLHQNLQQNLLYVNQQQPMRAQATTARPSDDDIVDADVVDVAPRAVDNRSTDAGIGPSDRSALPPGPSSPTPSPSSPSSPGGSGGGAGWSDGWSRPAAGTQRRLDTAPAPRHPAVAAVLTDAPSRSRALPELSLAGRR